MGFGLTIPSGTVHRLVGAEEVVELKKKLWHFLCFTGGIKLLLWKGVEEDPNQYFYWNLE